jgi:hypothetical protein
VIHARVLTGLEAEVVGDDLQQSAKLGVFGGGRQVATGSAAAGLTTASGRLG